MIIDRQLQVSNEQAVTSDAASTDVIDFGQANPNVGMDDRSHMVITVDETATAAGSAIVAFQIQDSADNSSWAVIAAAPSRAKALLVAGYQEVIPMPKKVRRYVRMYYVVVTGPLTAGKFSAQIVTGLQLNTPYPDSPSIS